MALLAVTAVEHSVAFRLLGSGNDPTAGIRRQPHEWAVFRHYDLREFHDCRVPFTVNPVNNDAVGHDSVLAASDTSFKRWTDVNPSEITLYRQPASSGLSAIAMDNVSLVYWADGAEDDVQLIPVGSGSPNWPCVELLGGGTVPGGDDQVLLGWILTGADGICQTAAAPPDLQIIPVGQGEPDQFCVGPGPNNVLETDPAGDDTYSAGYTNIHTGPDGICNTAANAGSIDYIALTATYHSISSGVIFESDIHMNDEVTWNIGTENPPLYDIQVTLTHEAGHFIGLHHSEVGTATMHGTWWPNDLSKRSLEQDDRRGCNFLYTPDIGDAPDPDCGGFNLYPSQVHKPNVGRTLNGVQLDSVALGAEHIFGTKGPNDPDDSYLYEWLGVDISGECESNQTNDDPHDDGVSITVDAIDMVMEFEVTVTTDSDDSGNFHDYGAHHLYLNIWVDWNCDCDWDGPGEHVIGPGEIVDPDVPGVTKVFTYSVPMPDCECDSLWIRARLDWGEDCGVVNNKDGSLNLQYRAAQFGEVEDYVVICPFSPWHWKPPYWNYSPSGMPDFSQFQDGWMNQYTLQETFCGPVSIANCWWWFDSKYDDPSGSPGDGMDQFPLVRDYMDELPPYVPPYSDDHDMFNLDHDLTPWLSSPGPPPLTSQPFVPGPQAPGGGLPPWGELVERLAWYFDTDGVRSGDAAIVGTNVMSMHEGIETWLSSETFEDGSSLAESLCVVTTPMPTFAYVESLVQKCEDVILLLGFWYEDIDGSGLWFRVGGHYVTTAGVNSDEYMIGFSDPFVDGAEFGNPGNVGSGDHIPHGYPHSNPTVHNDAGNVSHDIYTVMESSPSPGGVWSLYDYPATTEPDVWMEPFFSQNVPDEFLTATAPWNGVSYVHTEVEYCVHISPWHYRGDVNNDGIVDVGDVVYLISFLYRGGPPPVPMSMGDVNCDGIANLGDVVFLIGYLYRGGPIPRCCDP
jgi:hypothetical protein